VAADGAGAAALNAGYRVRKRRVGRCLRGPGGRVPHPPLYAARRGDPHCDQQLHVRRRDQGCHAAGGAGRADRLYGCNGTGAQAEATKAAQRAGIEHAKEHGDRAYLGRKPSFTRAQLAKVRHMLSQEAVGIARIAKETGLTRQTVYRIKDDPGSAEAALVAWGL
jgi:hypothetical protein